jgi:YidC/Oxa1 family membrane protein insertase
MKNPDVVRALLWAAVIFLAWNILAHRIWPPVEKPAPETPPETVDAVDERPTPETTAEKQPEITEPDNVVTAGRIRVIPGEEWMDILGDDPATDNPEYGMSLVVSSIGASVVSADLTSQRLTVEEDSPPYPMLIANVGPEGRHVTSYTTERIHLLRSNQDVSLKDIPWKLMHRTKGRIAFSVDIDEGDRPLLRLTKSFVLPESTLEPSRYDLRVRTRIQNLSDQEQGVIVTQRGAVGVRREDPRFDDRMLFLATLQEGEVKCTETWRARSVKEETTIYKSDTAAAPIVWSATANKYFVAFETFLPADPTGTWGEWVAEIREIPVLPGPEGPESITFETISKRLTIAPEDAREITSGCFLGPKHREAFQEVQEYAKRGYDEQVLASYSSGSPCCSFMAFRPLTVFMIFLLNSLEKVVLNYGVAIIILVLVVRTILHPITKKGQVNMMRMQQAMSSLQPKMEELKKKYANDKAKLNQETMKLYQEAGVNPATQMLSSCLPMMLQMPIWIALYASLNYNIDMRHEPFMLWIKDLTAPDAMIEFSKCYSVPLLGSLIGPVCSFNLLPILVSAFMFMQQKFMPKSKPAQAGPQSEQAAQMQKMMPYMTLFFGLLFYNMPSGLNLYIWTSSFFAVIEQWRIRKHLEDLKGKEPKEPDDAAGGIPSKPKPPKKPSFFARLKKAAEDAQRIQSTKDKKKKGKK